MADAAAQLEDAHEAREHLGHGEAEQQREQLETDIEFAHRPRPPVPRRELARGGEGAQVTKIAGHILNLGSGGDVRGNKVVAQGVREHVATVKGSYTGQYLRPMLEAAE
ncbi:hypothetical protein [Qipengyuania mesophila]|uniref:hypothetical protein n=1 Tax=Qipengyuania mesophila TaxID=2867246 RepID=UPI0035115183